jgi:hypothetical protein
MKPSLLGRGGGGGGAEQQHIFDDIKKYLFSPPMMKESKSEIPFRLYIADKDSVIGAVLTQVMDGKKYIIRYLS